MTNRGKDILGSDRLQDYRESLTSWFCTSDWTYLKMLSDENVSNAWNLEDRLIAEVEGVLEAVLEHPNLFPDDLRWGSAELHALMNEEEELLVPYECWYEKYVLREAERVGNIEIRYSPGVVPEVEAGNVRNARLTDASGDLVLHYEGMEVAIVDEKLDGKIPLRGAVEGTVRLLPSGE